jgi:hypothetical protein
MNTTRVMSLVAATVFALGVAGSAVAQTPTTPAPAPAQTAPPAKGGDMQMEKKDKKDGKAADKQHTKKKQAAAKKTEGDMKTAPETKAPEAKK